MTVVESSRMSLRRRTLLAVAVSAIGLSGAARAQGSGDLVDLTVVDRESGQPMRVWRHDGRMFVAGQPGARYALRVSNHSPGRVMVVMSVDGVNIVTGETAGFDQIGYVLDPFQSYDVTGWRKSNTEVAAFTFTSLPNSYAARTGRPADVGVIGLAAFRERVAAPAASPIAEAKARPPRGASSEMSEIVVTGQRTGRASAPPPPPLPVPAPPAAAARIAPSAPPPADVAMAERKPEKLGTGHGAREWSMVHNVDFEKATSRPQLIRRIEYDSYENLAVNGVIPRPWEPGRRPRPFPQSGDGAGYVPDPPGRP